MQSTNNSALASVPAMHGGRPLFEERFRFLPASAASTGGTL